MAVMTDKMTIRILLFIFGMAAVALAQITAEIYETNIQEDSVVELKITVSGDNNAKAPEEVKADGLQIRLAGESKQCQMVNFTTNSSITFSYMVSPTKSGILEIPPIDIKSKGNILFTKKMSLTVTPKTKNQSNSTSSTNSTKPSLSMAKGQPFTSSTNITLMAFEDAKYNADNKNDSYSQAILAEYYYLGYKTLQDLELARKYAQKSKEQDNPLGIYELGRIEGDNPTGNDLILKSCIGLKNMGDDPIALTALGEIGIKKGYQKEGIEYIKKAADMGYAPALYNMAVISHEGKLINRNEDQYNDFINKAIAGGFKKAQDYKKSIENTKCYSSENATGFKNINEIIMAFPNLMEDPLMLTKLSSIPLDTTTFELDPQNNVNLFGLHQVTSQEYLDKILKINKEYFYSNQKGNDEKSKITTVKALQQYPEVWELIQKELKGSNLDLDDFRNEFKDLENQVFAPSKGNDGFICCKSGVIIINTSLYYGRERIIIFIPRAILLHTRSFGFSGGTPLSVKELGWTKAKYLFFNLDNGKSYQMPSNDDFTRSPSQRGLLYQFVLSFNIHQSLYALNEIKSKLDKKLKSEDSDKKLMGYTGISFGMDQSDVLDKIRSQIDYSKSKAPKTFNYSDNNELENYQKKGVVDFVLDLCFATGGLVLTPPWSISIVNQNEKHQPLDVFIFTKNRLLTCGRYFSYGSSNISRHDSFDIPCSYFSGSDSNDENNESYQALIKKYGPVKSSEIGLIEDSSGVSASGLLRLKWIQDDGLNIAALFQIGTDSKSILRTSSDLPFIDSLGNALHIQKRYWLLPWSLDRINLENPLKLVYIFYWNKDSSDELKILAKEFINKIKQSKKEELEKRIDNRSDDL